MFIYFLLFVWFTVGVLIFFFNWMEKDSFIKALCWPLILLVKILGYLARVIKNSYYESYGE